jgi:Na+(H+)/acetate symporter ActP
VIWGIWIIGSFYLMTLALGFGAAALVGPEEIIAQDPAGNTAAPQLARAVGEDFTSTAWARATPGARARPSSHAERRRDVEVAP